MMTCRIEDLREDDRLKLIADPLEQESVKWTVSASPTSNYIYTWGGLRLYASDMDKWEAFRDGEVIQSGVVE